MARWDLQEEFINSHPGKYYYERFDTIKEVKRPQPDVNELQQVKAHLIYMQNKLNEHIDASVKASKRKRGKYD